MIETLEDKVGQMLMGGFDGTTAPAYFLDWLRAGRLGGVILFARNVESKTQLAALTAELHAAAKYPLLIAIDQEGGTVARLRWGFSESIGAMALAGIPENPNDAAESASAVLGAEMHALGINWTYAPVVDITYNKANPTVGTRSFGTDPATVGEMAAGAVRGFQGAGVAACAKHFPGLGDTDLDTHLALPRLATPVEQLRAVDMVPYRATLAAGLASVMTTHTIYSTLDPDHPATLSPVIVRDLLRGELGFTGVVTTDCMEMKAIDDHYGVADSVVRAAVAGIDIILFSHTAAKQASAYDHLLAAVERGEVPLAVVEAANVRIAALKERFPASPADVSAVYTDAHREIMTELARRSITLARVASDTLPLSGRARLVEFSPAVDTIAQEATDDSSLCYYVGQTLPHVELHLLPATPSEADLARLMTQPTETLVIATRNAHLIPAQRDAVTALAASAENVVLVALRNPHDIHLAASGTALCSGGDSRPSLMALTEALAGAFEPTGQIDV